MKKYIYTFFTALCLMAFTSLEMQAIWVRVTSKHDKQKFKQWTSMENGTWQFSPDWYYYILHKNYSGAKLSGFKIKFNETKSNVRRCFIPRSAQLVEALEIKKKSTEQHDTISTVYKEEKYLSIDRNVDLKYSEFKNEFQTLREAIDHYLNYCLEKSKGKLLEAVNLLKHDKDIIEGDIEYTHKTGVGYELENAKRELSYEDALKKLNALLKASEKLVFYANCYY